MATGCPENSQKQVRNLQKARPEFRSWSQKQGRNSGLGYKSFIEPFIEPFNKPFIKPFMTILRVVTTFEDEHFVDWFLRFTR